MKLGTNLLYEKQLGYRASLEKAAKALAEKQAFGELSALYVRKSSAEINAGK